MDIDALIATVLTTMVAIITDLDDTAMNDLHRRIRLAVGLIRHAADMYQQF